MFHEFLASSVFTNNELYKLHTLAKECTVYEDQDVVCRISACYDEGHLTLKSYITYASKGEHRLEDLEEDIVHAYCALVVCVLIYNDRRSETRFPKSLYKTKVLSWYPYDTEALLLEVERLLFCSGHGWKCGPNSMEEAIDEVLFRLDYIMERV